MVSANEFSTSRWASFSPLPMRNRFEVCHSLALLDQCLDQEGWQWPSAFTAMPR
jgi:hypothetical protein